MTRKSIQIRPDWIAGAICDLQSVLFMHCRAAGSAISLGKGCHGNDLWMLCSLQRSHISGRNYPGFLYVRPEILLLYFLTLCCAVSSPSASSLVTNTPTHRHAHTHTRWAIWILAFMPTHPCRLHIGLLCNQFEILYNQIHKITFFFYFGESARMNVI